MTAAQTTAPNQQQSSASQTAAKTAIQSQQPQSQRQFQRLIEHQRQISTYFMPKGAS